MSAPKQVMVVYGTRPEAIKMAPVIHRLLHSRQFSPVVVVTGQHRSMLDQVHADFGIHPDHDLDIMSTGQTLEDITVRSLQGVSSVIHEQRPDTVLVQGDTTSAMSAALAAFYARVPVVHLEAGLRTNDACNPYPEEINRRLTGRLASLHLAPTPASRDNLLRENVSPRDVLVTGNTVIDALLWTVAQDRGFSDPRLLDVERSNAPVLLVTVHRRESWGRPIALVGKALVELARRFPDLQIVLPAHRNPVVRNVLLPLLAPAPSVLVLDPLPYADFARLMALSRIVLTDSGGVQEEAPSLGKPVLVMRDSTERPEGVMAGNARLVGTHPERIVAAVESLLTDQSDYRSMAQSTNPYGDGCAARRTVAALDFFLNQAPSPSEFEPRPSAAARRH
jgi:UDP-N-acetylglucosamine 2-epimerase (non-hydrolysing)